MPKFYIKKTSLGEGQNSLVFKGKVIEGPINRGMILEIPIACFTDGASDVVPVKIFDIVHFEKQKDELKKVGLVADFYDSPDDMEVILGLNIADEEVNVNNTEDKEEW